MEPPSARPPDVDIVVADPAWHRMIPNAGAIVRAMPNTPAAIGRGITVAVSPHASGAQRALADSLLAATGAIEWIEDETQMDAVTAE